jgi:hypothetical protein
MLRGTPEAPTARHLNALICRISRGVTGGSPVAACMVTWPGACNGVVPVADRLPDGMLSLACPERGQTIQDSAASAHGPRPWNLAGVA